MAAYRRVYDSRHLQADCQEPGSAPEPYVRQSSMGYLLEQTDAPNGYADDKQAYVCDKCSGSSRHERVVARPRETSSEALTLAAG